MRRRVRRPVPWWRAAWQQYGCTRCGAAPGDPCVTDSGKVKYEPHVDRARLASENRWKEENRE